MIVALALSGLTVIPTANAAIAYVQGTYQNPDSSGLVSATYASAQVAGDLNVVVVGWNDSTSTVSAISDSKGNTYFAAVGPTTNAGNATQRVYYAKNIAGAAAGGNTVTVTFSTTVAYPDVRILEYSGLDPSNPLDVGIGASGTGATQSSGSLSTTNANDLLVASNYVADSTTASGSGYTQRFITNGGELVEDQVASATGSYSATSTQGGADWWVMQLVAFRAASSGDTTPPTAPTAPSATATSGSQINLTWTASTDNVGVTGYRVERCAGASCTSFAQIGTPTTTSYSDTGLTASTSYRYRIRATDAAGNLSAYSSTVTATTSTTTVTAITYVQGAFQNPNSGNSTSATYPSAQSAGNLNVIAVGWSDSVSTVTSITDSAGNSYVAAVGPTTSSGNASQRIYYAKSISGAAAGANTVTVTFNATVTYPALQVLEYHGADPVNPFDVGVGASGIGTTQNSGTLTTTNASDMLVAFNYVDDSTTAAGAGYTQRVTTSGGDIAEDEALTTTGAYSATSTQSGADWWVMQLAAFRAASNGGGDTTAPSAPGAPSVSIVSSTAITLSWAASTDNVGVTGYVIQRCAGTGCTSFAQIGTSSTTTFNDSGLTASTTYSYRVQATDAAGNLSTYSSTSSGTTSASGTNPGGGDTTPPTAPGTPGLTVASPTAINLGWAASTDNVGVTGYLVERCLGAGCATFAQIGSSTTTSYGDIGLTASTSYSYRIRATDAAGNLSSYSGTSSATTSAAGDTQPPSNPTNLTATPGPMDTVLSWTASTDNVGVTGYMVERCQEVSCTNFAQIATVAGSTTNYSDSGITADVSYQYRVRATDAAGNLSGYSTITSDVPLDCD